MNQLWSWSWSSRPGPQDCISWVEINHVSHDLFPGAMPNVSRVLVTKLLGVHLRHDLNFSQHVESVVATCIQRLYLLAQLKKQGLGISAIDSMFKAIVLNRILYAVPVYFGYLTEGQKDFAAASFGPVSYTHLRAHETGSKCFWPSVKYPK